jgi:tetratricopeptide (TPR) repeat protein
MIPSYVLSRGESTPSPPRAAALPALIALIALAALALAALGCGSMPAAPAGPAPSTQELIGQAEAAETQRRYDRARALYEQAKRQAPDPASRAAAARASGRALIFWGEHERAAAELEQAARLEPGDAGTWHDLGMVRHHLNDVAGAETAFRRSIAARPGDGRSRIALAALLWKHGRLDQALREYEALRRVDLPGSVRAKVEWAIEVLRERTGQEP